MDTINDSPPVVIDLTLSDDETDLERESWIHPSLDSSNNVCDHSCNETHIDKTKQTSMLAIPMQFGFKRFVVKLNDNHKSVLYLTPSGITIHKIEEMFDYLIETKNKITIDMFDFNVWVNPFTEFKVLHYKNMWNDISHGKEFKEITCVNSIDQQIPPPLQYITSRQAMPGVNMNVEDTFLCSCDCTDNCQDKSKCACSQLTYDAQMILPTLYRDPNIGYHYRRLHEKVVSGIYECNKNCKCSSSCLNRVVQYPMSHKLQLFMTENKGWGVRCLNDIPQGSFICNFIGLLLAETKDNKFGFSEYMAQLDYIETVEQIKKDYESDVTFSDQEQTNNNDENLIMPESSNKHFQSTSEDKHSTSKISTRIRKRKSLKKTDKTKRYGQRYVSKDNTRNKKKKKIDKSVPIRKLYGNTEEAILLDCETSGNISRFFNHSCGPNLFIQNVFVDTHDLRFPWISFFAQKFLPAGTELTWDYNYEVGSTPGKKVQCRCNSSNCRSKLL